MSKPYVTQEEEAVRILHEYTPVCRVCGDVIMDPDEAVRVPGGFRLRHRDPCEPQPRPAA